MDIFLTNDDGVHSPGFLALKNELNSLGSLLLVGPSEEKSWISKGITRFGTVKVQKIKLEDGTDVFSVQGTPVDATILGLLMIAENLPKLVVSGINLGTNAGNAFIYSSGTVGAAIEAAMIGIPAIAVSLMPNYANNTFSQTDFKYAARLTKIIAQRIIKYGLPVNVDLINMNFPFGVTADTEIVITKVAKLHYGCVLKKSSRKNEFVFTKEIHSAERAKYDFKPGTDAYTLFIENKISITPINIDLTGNLQNFKNWMELKL